MNTSDLLWLSFIVLLIGAGIFYGEWSRKRAARKNPDYFPDMDFEQDENLK